MPILDLDRRLIRLWLGGTGRSLLRLLDRGSLHTVSVTNLRCQRKLYSEVQGFAGRPIDEFPPCWFFHEYLRSPDRARRDLGAWYEEWSVAREAWVASQSWYQTIPVADGIVLPGTTDSLQRLDVLGLPEDLSGRSVLDVGASSGMYCFEAERRGVERVVGIEPQSERIEQARTLAEILDLEVDFFEKGLLDSLDLGRFDIVLCFAVVTEVTDLIHSLETLEGLTRHTLYLELAVFGQSPGDLRLAIRPFGDRILRLLTPRSSAKLRRTKTGWSIAPSLVFLEAMLGHAFDIHDLGPSVRYRMLKLVRRDA